ncbi:MAG: M60 family metallopeptidase [Bacteroidetes bacterium]|nr:M60 family metallopeptidase [Bacteroidota bacterium]
MYRPNLIALLMLCSLTALAQPASTDSLQVVNDLQVFADPLALTLKKGVKQARIDRMQNAALRATALALRNKNYLSAYRSADYSAWLSPEALGRELMIGDGYSRYENATGIYLPEGNQVVLVSGIAAGKKVELLVPNWNRHAPPGIVPTEDPAGWGIVKQSFQLKNGVNVVPVGKAGGLAYISYYSDRPEGEKTIRVHFPNAQVNGYFDITRNNDADWNQLLQKAVYPMIDAKGRHIQIVYPVADCEKYAHNRGVELISNYDSLVFRQHRLLGLIKYNRVPKNHILARVNFNYYMFRDEDGVAYMGTSPGNAMPLVVDPSRVIKGDPCWGFSHEVGHVHQVRPALNWGGLGEVSNNIFALYVTTSFGNRSRLSEQDNYKKAKDSIISQQKCYLQDKDVFNRLVPFWQLQLYFSGPGMYPDFYPDLFESIRKEAADERQKTGDQKTGGWGDRGENPASWQLAFVEKVCAVGKTDLTEFFEQYGFFKTGSFAFDDYGDYHYNMTTEMVAATKARIAAMKLPAPKMDLSSLKD